MAERQIHGFLFEEAIKEILKVKTKKSYTSKWDIGDNISVKFITLSGTVDMGSAVRIFEALENPGWSLILGRHDNKICVSVYKLLFTEEVCNKLKGDLTLEEIRDFDNRIKEFSVGFHEDARNFAKQWKKENKEKTGLLTIQPKIDSKLQRRVQCGINNTNLKKLFDLSPSDEFMELVGKDFGKIK